MAVTGQQCLGLVVQASETFRSGDLEEAQKQLKNLSGATVTLIRKITEKERILNGIDDEKKEEEKCEIFIAHMFANGSRPEHGPESVIRCDGSHPAP